MTSTNGHKTLSEIKSARALRRLIWKNCEKLRHDHDAADVEILHEGVTGGYWSDWVTAHCERRERSNAAAYIKQHGAWDDERETYVLEGCFVVTGAGVGGSRGHFAKQKEFVVVRLVY